MIFNPLLRHGLEHPTTAAAVAFAIPDTEYDYYVNLDNGIDTNAGKDIANPLLTIAQALSLVSAGDNVFVFNGTSAESITIPANVSVKGHFTFTGDVTLNSGSVFQCHNLAPTGTNAVKQDAAFVSPLVDHAILNVTGKFTVPADSTGILINNGGRITSYVEYSDLTAGTTNPHDTKLFEVTSAVAGTLLYFEGNTVFTDDNTTVFHISSTQVTFTYNLTTGVVDKSFPFAPATASYTIYGDTQGAGGANTFSGKAVVNYTANFWYFEDYVAATNSDSFNYSLGLALSGATNHENLALVTSDISGNYTFSTIAAAGLGTFATQIVNDRATLSGEANDGTTLVTADNIKSLIGLGGAFTNTYINSFGVGSPNTASVDLSTGANHFIEIDTAAAVDDIQLTLSNPTAGQIVIFSIGHGATQRTITLYDGAANYNVYTNDGLDMENVIVPPMSNTGLSYRFAFVVGNAADLQGIEPLPYHVWTTLTSVTENISLLLEKHRRILVDTSSNNVTVNFTNSAASCPSGPEWKIKCIDATNVTTIDPTGGETIDGVAAPTLLLNEVLTFESDGSNYLLT